MRKYSGSTKKEFLEKVGDWPSVQVRGEYELGSNKLTLVYDGETVVYEDERLLTVAYFALQFGLITNRDYEKLFDELFDELS